MEPVSNFSKAQDTCHTSISMKQAGFYTPMLENEIETMTDKKTMLTPAEVARKLGVSPITVRSWVVKGWLKANVTPGGHRRFYAEDVEKLVQEHAEEVQKPKSLTRILVVDDDPLIRSILVEWLSDFDPQIDVAEATNGFQAGLMTAEFSPHIIFMDYAMPGLTGADICRQIKTNTQHTDTRIIAITGHDKPGIEQEMLEAGADAVLLKPFTPDQISKVLDLASDN